MLHLAFYILPLGLLPFFVCLFLPAKLLQMLHFGWFALVNSNPQVWHLLCNTQTLGQLIRILASTGKIRVFLLENTWLHLWNFYWIKFYTFPLKQIKCWFSSVLGVIILLDSEPPAKPQIVHIVVHLSLNSDFFPVPNAAKHPNSMMLPLPCFALEMGLFGVAFSPEFYLME